MIMEILTQKNTSVPQKKKNFFLKKKFFFFSQHIALLTLQTWA